MRSHSEIPLYDLFQKNVIVKKIDIKIYLSFINLIFNIKALIDSNISIVELVLINYALK